jgi:hypothetical protein
MNLDVLKQKVKAAFASRTNLVEYHRKYEGWHYFINYDNLNWGLREDGSACEFRWSDSIVTINSASFLDYPGSWMPQKERMHTAILCLSGDPGFPFTFDYDGFARIYELDFSAHEQMDMLEAYRERLELSSKASICVA